MNELSTKQQQWFNWIMQDYEEYKEEMRLDDLERCERNGYRILAKELREMGKYKITKDDIDFAKRIFLEQAELYKDYSDETLKEVIADGYDLARLMTIELEEVDEPETFPCRSCGAEVREGWGAEGEDQCMDCFGCGERVSFRNEMM